MLFSRVLPSYRIPHSTASPRLTVIARRFRLNVRKLGLSDKEAATAELDLIYDDLDLSGDGSLDINEMKIALKGLQQNAHLATAAKARTKEWVSDLRKVSKLYRASAADTEDYEMKAKQLEQLRHCTQYSNSPATFLAMLFKKNRITGEDFPATFDAESVRTQFCETLDPGSLSNAGRLSSVTATKRLLFLAYSLWRLSTRYLYVIGLKDMKTCSRRCGFCSTLTAQAR